MNRTKLTALIGRPNRRTALYAALAVLILATAGAAVYLLAGRAAGGDGAEAACPGSRVLYWYDPMAPDRRFDAPGKSPFMDMPLVAKCAEESAEGVRVSPAMVQNLGVRTAPARMMDLAPAVRAVGRVEFDERLIAEVQTLTPGFVEQLTVRAVGEPVQRGARIATVYSPELLAAQNEYKALLAARGATSESLRQAARQRLALLGLPAASIRRLDRGGAAQRTYPVFAPASGVVTQIGARPGAQVAPGQSLATIAGLSRVWVIAELPETFLGDVRVGLPAEIGFPAYPDETRQGLVDYIFPQLDPEARTARVRITLANPGQRLRQGMFANVTILGAGGMALVVPSEAVIDTGRRKVVIVRRNDAFVPAAVTTGRELQDWTQILSGVEAGAQVVVSGQFLIDSEASLSGMMERLNANAPREGASPQLPETTGTIRSMDLQRGSVTIAHGPVPVLNWPAMTMTFAVRNTALLRGLGHGDRVAFAFRQEGNSYVIQQIGRAPAR